MTIQEIKEDKKKLETKITDLILEYERDTKTYISSVDLDITCAESYGGDRYRIIDVKIKVEL